MITDHRYDAGWPRNDVNGCIADDAMGLTCRARESAHAASEYPQQPRQRLTPGQAAYEKLRDILHDDTPLSEWSALSTTGKEQWETVAKAAINQHIDNRDAREQAYEPPRF